MSDPDRSFAERVYDEVRATVARRARRGMTRRGGFAGPGMYVCELGATGSTPLLLTPLGAGYLRMRFGVFGLCEFGYGPDRAADTVTEAVEWLDAVLDGRVRETVWLRGREPRTSVVEVTWRDGDRTRIPGPQSLAARIGATGERVVRYDRYDQY